jgi:hypothetical protein
MCHDGLLVRFWFILLGYFETNGFPTVFSIEIISIDSFKTFRRVGEIAIYRTSLVPKHCIDTHHSTSLNKKVRQLQVDPPRTKEYDQ